MYTYIIDIYVNVSRFVSFSHSVGAEMQMNLHRSHAAHHDSQLKRSMLTILLMCHLKIHYIPKYTHTFISMPFLLWWIWWNLILHNSSKIHVGWAHRTKGAVVLATTHLSLDVRNSQGNHFHRNYYETPHKPFACISETIAKLLLQLYWRHLYGSAQLTVIHGKLRQANVQIENNQHYHICMCTLYTKPTRLVHICRHAFAYMHILCECVRYFHFNFTAYFDANWRLCLILCIHIRMDACSEKCKHRPNRNESRKTYT